ncbi:trypsin-like peptidase domain-containing protein [Streptomyces sp. NPDC018031]|uniref:trypsin-like peptidase domain-containing protein n=1 Tax=Streptomyces sp. NPDC018031 TaxID=3365033 RepID=UPI0037B0533C
MHHRVAAVQIPGGRGSGYLLTPRLLLTAAHVVRDEPDARVTVVGGTGTRRARVVWRGAGVCDAALLVSAEDLVRPETAARLPPVRWARLTDDSPLGGCQAMGFPRAQHDRTRGVDLEHIECALRPGSGIVRYRYVLDVKDVAPEPAGGRSPWEGMSGAALFAQGLLLGVVTEAPGNWRHRRLEAVKGATLLDDASFVAAFTRHAGTAPPVDALSSATRTRKPLVLAGTLHSAPRELAATIRAHWTTARQQFFDRAGGTPPGPTTGRRDLLTWLQQFDDPFTDDVEARRELIDRRLTDPEVTPDLKVLHLLGWLDPDGEAVWKGTRVTLESLATACLRGRLDTDGPAAEVYRDLRAGGLLEALADFTELRGLRGTQQAWDDAWRSWRRAAGPVDLPDRAREWADGDARGMLLAALLPDPRTGEWIRTAFGRLTPPAAGRVAWYDRLCERGGDPGSPVGQLVRTDFAAYAAVDAERRAERAARAEEDRALAAARAEHERQWAACEARRLTPAARWGAAVRVTLWLGAWGVVTVPAAWLVWGWTRPSMAVTLAWHLPALSLAAYAARLPRAVRLGAAYRPPLRSPRKWLPADRASLRGGLLKAGFVFGAVLVAGVLLHDVGRILTTAFFACLCLTVYRYAGHGHQGPVPSSLRDWDDGHQARLRTRVTVRKEAGASRDTTRPLPVSARERAAVHQALITGVAGGGVGIAGHERWPRSTDRATGQVPLRPVSGPDGDAGEVWCGLDQRSTSPSTPLPPAGSRGATSPGGGPSPA